jgi:hypothetical protein
VARRVTVVKPKHTSKWTSLCNRIAKLREGESIVLEHEGDPTEEVQRIRSGLNRVRSCTSIRRTIRVVEGKIVITRMGMWRRPPGQF